MKKKTILFLTVFFFLLAFAVLRPVPIVSKIFEGGVKDVAFRLENNDRIYYINRGLEAGLELEDLRARIVGKEVVFKYPDYWTPLDWNGKTKHVSKVEVDGEIVFNELK